MACELLALPCPVESLTPPEAPSAHLRLYAAPQGPEAWDLTEEPPIPSRPEDEATIRLEPRGTTGQKLPPKSDRHPHPAQPELWAKTEAWAESVIAKLHEAERPDLAEPLEQCHTSYTVAWCPHCHATKMFPNRCENFACPRCQNRLANDRAASIRWWVIDLRQPKHIVLTVKNIKALTPQHIDEFRSWFTRLRHRKFAKNWSGGFYSIEVTHADSGWHLHLHALIEAKWIDQGQLAREWADINRGYGHICKVKDCRGLEYLRQVLKYVVKGNELSSWSPSLLVQFIEAFRGKRTFGVFGQLFGQRTEFADWLKSERAKRPRCECGCSDVKYFTETEWMAHDLQPHQTHPPRPPPAAHYQSHLIAAPFRWPD
jgi:hypothetical protein